MADPLDLDREFAGVGLQAMGLVRIQSRCWGKGNRHRAHGGRARHPNMGDRLGKRTEQYTAGRARIGEKETEGETGRG